MEAEFAGDEVKHRNNVVRVAVASGLALDGAEDAVQALHEGGAQLPFPVS